MKKRYTIYAGLLVAVGATGLIYNGIELNDSTSSGERIDLDDNQSNVVPEVEVGKYLPQEALTEGVRTVVSDESLGYNARLRATHGLSMELPVQDLSILMDFISGEKVGDCTKGQWHGLVNDILNALRGQKVAAAGLTQTMVNIYRESDDHVMKDYAIQHLLGWYADRGINVGYEKDPALRNLILHTILDGAKHTEYNYAGTALISLHHIDVQAMSSKDEAFRQEVTSQLGDWESLLLSAAKGEGGACKHCQISAIQLCARRNMEDVLPTARLLAPDQKADTNLRLSAIAAMGQLGTLETDGEILKGLGAYNRRLRYAVDPAMDKLKAR